MMNITTAASALLVEIVRAYSGEFALDLPGNDAELSELFEAGLIEAAPIASAPYRFVPSEAFFGAFEVVDPEFGTSHGLEPRNASRFTIRPLYVLGGVS